MRDHRPTATTELIDGSRFKKLQEHAGEILMINQALKQILPRGTEDHIRAANIRHGQLVIEAASAGLKMKIERDRLNILNQLRNHGFAKLISIEIRINPAIYRIQNNDAETRKEAKSRPPISEDAAGYLLAVAEHAPDKIQKRLQRLADMAKKR